MYKIVHILYDFVSKLQLIEKRKWIFFIVSKRPHHIFGAISLDENSFSLISIYRYMHSYIYILYSRVGWWWWGGGVVHINLTGVGENHVKPFSPQLGASVSAGLTHLQTGKGQLLSKDVQSNISDYDEANIVHTYSDKVLPFEQIYRASCLVPNKKVKTKGEPCDYYCQIKTNISNTNT